MMDELNFIVDDTAERFWRIVPEKGEAPKQKFYKVKTAVGEARRLANASPHQGPYYVMEAVVCVRPYTGAIAFKIA